MLISQFFYPFSENSQDYPRLLHIEACRRTMTELFASKSLENTLPELGKLYWSSFLPHSSVYGSPESVLSGVLGG